MPEEYKPQLRALRQRRSALRSMWELARWRAKPKEKEDIFANRHRVASTIGSASTHDSSNCGNGVDW